jgi:RNA-directed DNA polymerase
MSFLTKLFFVLLVWWVISRIIRYLRVRRMRRRASEWESGLGSADVQRKSLEGLDASRFVPVADEMKDFARSFGRGSLRGSWTDRDRIPSAETPRTRMIDRAMVGLGLLTQEELDEAHRVGKLVDEATGDERLARDEAEAEAFKSIEDRIALKEKKKAEAAKRREEHAKQVAHRRETDIVFLGRGVSKGLADRRANVERLEAYELPVMATPADVAEAMGLTIPRLRWLAYHSEATSVSHYVRFVVPKNSGGSRTLFSPHKDMASTQRWILDEILSKVPCHEAAHGFISGRSTVTNAVPHVGQDVVVNVDLKDFFPSVTFPRVKGMFQAMGYSPAVATILALLCTECPRRVVEYDGRKLHVASGPRGLPQGACTSPAMSNLVTRKLDARLQGFCSKMGWKYTRYADDMTFSGKGEALNQVGYLLARVRHVIEEEGFRLNDKKTRVLKRSTAQTVTGVVVNERPGISRKEVKRIRAILHNAKKYGLESQNRDDHPDFEAWLSGMIAYISMVSPEQGRALNNDFLKVGR